MAQGEISLPSGLSVVLRGPSGSEAAATVCEVTKAQELFKAARNDEAKGVLSALVPYICERAFERPRYRLDAGPGEIGPLNLSDEDFVFVCRRFRAQSFDAMRKQAHKG